MKHLLSILIFLSFMSVASAECISGDCSNGFGTYIYDSGAKYVGEYKEQEMHGQGTFTHPDGTTESGIWKNDVLETKTN